MGILDLLQTAAAVVLAAPIAMLGVAYLLDGRVLGGAFILVAILLVVVQRILLTPEDVSLGLASDVTEQVVLDPADTDQEENGVGEDE